MKAQVLFLPPRFTPTEEDREHFEKVQKALDLWHAEFFYKAKDLDAYHRKMYKEKAHQGMRKRMCVVKG